MAFKALLMVMFIVGSYGFPSSKIESDMPIYFDHMDSSSSRIVGGTAALATPYMIALTSGVLLRGILCGGTIVTTRHVLTAGHCVIGSLSGNNLISSLRGTVGTPRWTRGGLDYKFSGHISHPEYDTVTRKNDIGFLMTSTDIVLSNTVSLVTLNFDWIGAGVSAKVYGWGRIRVGSTFSRDLLELSTTVIDGETCSSEITRMGEELNISPRPPAIDPSLEICIFRGAGEGTCHGDSGGPLVLADDNQQIGVVAWGLPCARGAPDIFTRISAFRNWIQQVIA